MQNVWVVKSVNAVNTFPATPGGHTHTHCTYRSERGLQVVNVNRIICERRTSPRLRDSCVIWFSQWEKISLFLTQVISANIPYHLLIYMVFSSAICQLGTYDYSIQRRRDNRQGCKKKGNVMCWNAAVEDAVKLGIQEGEAGSEVRNSMSAAPERFITRLIHLSIFSNTHTVWAAPLPAAIQRKMCLRFTFLLGSCVVVEY